MSVSNHSICLLFLVLALGLILATPTPGSRQEAIIKKLLVGKPDRAELFFRSARSLCDSDSGFEDADFWSIQALSLMTMYMMIVSKRNRAYAYLGKELPVSWLPLLTGCQAWLCGQPTRWGCIEKRQ